MGVRDTEEMLEAAQAQSLLDERTIAGLVAERDDLTRTVAAQTAQITEIRVLCAAQTARWASRARTAVAAIPVAEIRAVLDRTEKETP